MPERLALIIARARSWGLFVAFICGFLFDSITLGREVSKFDLYLVSFYGTFALAAILLKTRDLPERADRVVSLLLQFCLGGSLSAVVVLYFRSAGQLYSLAFVAVLFIAMIHNELAHRDEPQRKLVWAMWCVSSAMLTNFVVPHIVGSVSSAWFYLSLSASVAIIIAVRALARAPWRSLVPSAVAAATLLVLWIAGAVPPVPLVFKNSLICTDFAKTGGEYRCRVDQANLLQRVGLARPQVSRDDDDTVYALTAVFAPEDVEVVMEHRWYRDGEDGWEQTDTMNFPISGGRKGGWRFWSKKRNISEGLWMVETAVKDGAVLGYEKFRVTTPAAPEKANRDL